VSTGHSVPHMKTQNFAAILLDFDGTTVDSEPVHCRAHQQFLASQGIHIGEQEILGNIGKSDRLFYGELMQRFGKTGDVFAWMAGKTDILKGLYRAHGLVLRPGVGQLLADAETHGVPVCLVTSTEREVAALGLSVIGLDKRIPARVCYEDVEKRKPAPDPYLLAARRLGVPPERCLAIEDSPNGVQSAVAAGAMTVALEGLIPAAALLAAGAARVVKTLSELVPLHTQPGATSTFKRA
jgi:HAD superfamily hydrolase (TIGR01509 family)